MKSTALLKIATSALIIGTTAVGCSTVGNAGGIASASTAKAERAADKAAAKARAAIAAKNFAAAIGFAETAVGLAPRVAGHRALLGHAYLGAGRFESAQSAFADVLTLSPGDGRSALNLALAEIATGKNDRALATLADYREKLASLDYGLALALAGDTKEAVRVLELLVRSPSADARSRQNLALAYALDGQWGPAKTTAAVDLAPADVDARILQWAALARPDAAPARVASLLGVTPAAVDRGRPVRLALAAPDTQLAAVAPPVLAVVPPPAAEPVPAVVVAPPVPAPVPVADVPRPAFEVAAPVVVPTPRPVRVAGAAKVVDAPLIRAATPPVKQAVVAAKPRTAAAPAIRPIEAGKFVVQLGAYENAAVSRDAWGRLSARHGLGGFSPANASARVGKASFVRLSVGGFATRNEAKLVCTRIQASGGKCFVRSMLGDSLASWAKGAPVAKFAKAPVKKPVRVAAR